MLGEDEVVIRSVFGELNLRVERFPVPLSNAEREDAERAAFALRTLLEFPEPRVWEQAQRLARALSPGEPLRLRELDTSLSSQSFQQDLRSVPSPSQYHSTRGPGVESCRVAC